MNKNLLFYTLHRQYDEIEYSSYFFNKSKFLKDNFEVVVHCNNPNRSIQELKDKCKFEAKTEIIVTTKNNGYFSGHIQAISDNFETLKRYNRCIHLHPDCYITDDSKLQAIFDTEFDYAVAPMLHLNKLCYCTDFFAFKPNLNIFYDYDQTWKNQWDYPAEHYFYDLLQGHATKKIKIIKRYPTLNGCGFREIDDFGLWHSHDNERVSKHIQQAC